jgi:hypothetical protein
VIKVRKVRTAEHATVNMGETRNAYKTALLRSERKSLLGRPRHKWHFKALRVRTGFIWLRMGLSGGIL